MPVRPVILSLHNYRWQTSLEVTPTINSLTYENKYLKQVRFSIQNNINLAYTVIVLHWVQKDQVVPGLN
jgi:hypothetical protein